MLVVRVSSPWDGHVRLEENDGAVRALRTKPAQRNLRARGHVRAARRKPGRPLAAGAGALRRGNPLGRSSPPRGHSFRGSLPGRGRSELARRRRPEDQSHGAPARLLRRERPGSRFRLCAGCADPGDHGNRPPSQPHLPPSLEHVGPRRPGLVSGGTATAGKGRSRPGGNRHLRNPKRGYSPQRRGDDLLAQRQADLPAGHQLLSGCLPLEDGPRSLRARSARDEGGGGERGPRARAYGEPRVL